MPIETSHWGRLAGRDYSLFTIRNRGGASLVLSDYGARVVQMNMPSPSGDLADVVLGFDAIGQYHDSKAYFGATVGRFGNRIRRGRFELDSRQHQVTCNDGRNALHGGLHGFDRRAWTTHTDADGATVTFSLVSPDGDQGFPGELRVTSAYTLSDDHRVRSVLRAGTDRPTLCNLVHHSYFNLAGHAAGDVLDQELQVDADFYAPVDDELVVTGEVLKVAGTAFDFRQSHAIRDRIRDLPGPGGYDHNWCLRSASGAPRRVLSAIDPASRRGFDLYTTEPGIQIYTGGYLNASVIGKGAKPYRQFAGFALEPQRFPDGPNLSHVPQSRLDPGDEYHQVYELRFHT